VAAVAALPQPARDEAAVVAVSQQPVPGGAVVAEVSQTPAPDEVVAAAQVLPMPAPDEAAVVVAPQVSRTPVLALDEVGAAQEQASRMPAPEPLGAAVVAPEKPV
jgi:hypothetical protein